MPVQVRALQTGTAVLPAHSCQRVWRDTPICSGPRQRWDVRDRTPAPESGALADTMTPLLRTQTARPNRPPLSGANPQTPGSVDDLERLRHRLSHAEAVAHLAPIFLFSRCNTWLRERSH